jgi:hypothetical protein
MITSDIVKKFIDCYNEFKYDGRLTIEQLVFAMDNFQKISFDIEDIVKVLNNRDFADYTQYNVMDFLNAVYNEHVYDLFLKERKEQKMCYWIINMEFYKIFNIYRILILKANLLISTIKGSLNEVIVKDFERTINIYISDGVTNIKKCLDFLRRNKFTRELVFCTKPFRNLVKMDEFGRMIFLRIFPNVDPDEFAKIYETDSDEDDEDEDGEELDPEIQTKLETVINNLARLNGGDNNNNTLVDPIKRLVKEALRKAGIDIDLDSNTTITVGGNTILTPSHISNENKGMTMNMSNMKSNNTTKTTMDSQTLQNMQSQMHNMMQNQKMNSTSTKNPVNNQKTSNNTSKKSMYVNDDNVVFSDYDREIESILNGIGTNTKSNTKLNNKTNTNTNTNTKTSKLTVPLNKVSTARKTKTTKTTNPTNPINTTNTTNTTQPELVSSLPNSVTDNTITPISSAKGRKSVKKTNL